MPSGKKHTFLGRTVEGKDIFASAPSPYGIPYSSTAAVSIDVINFTLLKENVGNDQGNLLYQFDASSTTPPIPANYYAHSTWDYDAGAGDRAILAYNTSATTYYSNQPAQAPDLSPLPQNTWILIVFSAGVYNDGVIPPVPSSVYVNTYFGQVPASYIPTDGWAPAINISAV